MKHFRYIALLLIINIPVIAEDIKVDFNFSYIFGIEMEQIQFNNIILGMPVYQQQVDTAETEEPLLKTEYVPPSYINIPYNTPFKICRYDSGRLYLLPQLMFEETDCEPVEGMDLSNSNGISLETTRVQINNIIYNNTKHNVTFRFDFEKLQLEQDDGIILLPATPPKHIDILLDWHEELLDLDAHLTGPVTPYSLERFHMFFGDINNDVNIAALNIGYGEFETKPEIITILPPIIDFETQRRDITLRPGFYQFSVQHFYGNGTLLDSNAIVWLQIGNDPYNRHLFELPYYENIELRGELDVWIVFELEVLHNRTVIVNPIQRYEFGISPPEVRSLNHFNR